MSEKDLRKRQLKKMAKLAFPDVGKRTAGDRRRLQRQFVHLKLDRYLVITGKASQAKTVFG
ncbi:MAG: hypothetical protein IIB13_06970 [Chloroflexi bacterium]|nr:hypothetical protein [Chloroflexota bacterium]